MPMVLGFCYMLIRLSGVQKLYALLAFCVYEAVSTLGMTQNISLKYIQPHPRVDTMP